MEPGEDGFRVFRVGLGIRILSVILSLRTRIEAMRRGVCLKALGLVVSEDGHQAVIRAKGIGLGNRTAKRRRSWLGSIGGGGRVPTVAILDEPGGRCHGCSLLIAEAKAVQMALYIIDWRGSH